MPSSVHVAEEAEPGMVVHAYDPCTQEAGEYHIWQGSLGCTVM